MTKAKMPNKQLPNRGDRNHALLALIVGGAIIGNMIIPGIGGAVAGGVVGGLVSTIESSYDRTNHNS